MSLFDCNKITFENFEIMCINVLKNRVEFKNRSERDTAERLANSVFNDANLESLSNAVLSEQIALNSSATAKKGLTARYEDRVNDFNKVVLEHKNLQELHRLYLTAVKIN